MAEGLRAKCRLLGLLDIVGERIKDIRRLIKREEEEKMNRANSDLGPNLQGKQRQRFIQSHRLPSSTLLFFALLTVSVS